MISYERYKELFEKLGETGLLTREEEQEFNVYEKQHAKLKYASGPVNKTVPSEAEAVKTEAEEGKPAA